MEPIATQVHAPAAYADRVDAIARLAGLRPDPAAPVALLIVEHLDAAATDPWLVTSLPHLIVSIEAEHIRIGPFVEPGVTACLRCLVAGLAKPAASHLGPVLDQALFLVAIGWAAHDLARWHAAQLPITWSATITLGTDLRREFRTELRKWPRHPHCGCCWGVAI